MTLERARHSRQLGFCALLAALSALVYLPLSAVAFVGITIAAWRWRLPAWVRFACAGITLILLLLLTFALPRTFEEGPVTIS